MSRSLSVTGLLVDSWRDQQPPQTESSEMNLPDGAIPASRPRGASGDAPATPRLMSMISLGAVKWKSYSGEQR
jgi:hypothetical protein